MIEVVYFSSNSGVTVKNSGDGDVFLEAVTYKLDKKHKKFYSGAMAVFISAEKGKFTTHKNKSQSFGQIVTKNQEFNDNEVEPVFCSSNDPAFKTFQDSLNEKMLTYSCNAKLDYFSLKRSERKSVVIPCVAYLLKKTSANKANSTDAKNSAAD